MRQSGTGISASNSDPVMVTVDSNLVSGNTYGMSLGEYPGVGPVHVTRNRITGSSVPLGGGYGVYFYYADPVRTLVDSNNIAGNQYGAYSYLGSAYQMPNNWWGDVNGPTCLPQDGPCSSSVVGDSVGAGLTNSWEPALTAPMPSGLPLNAPPARFVSRLSAVMARPTASAVRAVPVTRGASVRRVFVPRVPVTPRLATLAAPQGLKATQAEAVRRGSNTRAALMAVQQQRLVAASEAVASQLTARAARLAALKRAIAERDSLRAARVAEQVAAQQALHARRP